MCAAGRPCVKRGQAQGANEEQHSAAEGVERRHTAPHAQSDGPVHTKSHTREAVAGVTINIMRVPTASHAEARDSHHTAQMCTCLPSSGHREPSRMERHQVGRSHTLPSHARIQVFSKYSTPMSAGSCHMHPSNRGTINVNSGDEHTSTRDGRLARWRVHRRSHRSIGARQKKVTNKWFSIHREVLPYSGSQAREQGRTCVSSACKVRRSRYPAARCARRMHARTKWREVQLFPSRRLRGQ